MQQTLFEVTGVTAEEMIVNTVIFFKQRGWTIKEVKNGDTVTGYDLSYKNMIMRLKSSPWKTWTSDNIGWYYNNIQALSASFPDVHTNSFITNGLYTMRIRYVENENFIYVEIWSSGVSNLSTRSAFFSFNTKDIMDNSIVNYFGKRIIYEDSSNTNLDLTFKIASELDENYPPKYNFATYLKPIATTNSQMLMTENGIPLIDINLNINKGEIFGTKMLMGAIKNKTYKIGGEYWFCFYPNYVVLIEEKILITESEGAT